MIGEIIGIAIAILIAIFWPSIRTFLSRTLIPNVEKYLGPKFSDLLVSITQWLDGKLRAIHKGFAQAIKFLKSNILKMSTIVTRQPGGVLIGRRTVDVQMGDEVLEIVEPVKLEWDTLEPQFQAELLRQRKDADGNRNVSVDDKGLLMHQLKCKHKTESGLLHDAEEEAESREIEALLVDAD